MKPYNIMNTSILIRWLLRFQQVHDQHSLSHFNALTVPDLYIPNFLWAYSCTNKIMWSNMCDIFVLFIGELGGFLGLLLGASVLTLFEVMDAFLYFLFAKHCPRRRPQVAPIAVKPWNPEPI